jgi:hypothetical protein
VNEGLVKFNGDPDALRIEAARGGGSLIFKRSMGRILFVRNNLNPSLLGNFCVNLQMVCDCLHQPWH